MIPAYRRPHVIVLISSSSVVCHCCICICWSCAFRWAVSCVRIFTCITYLYSCITYLYWGISIPQCWCVSSVGWNIELKGVFDIVVSAAALAKRFVVQMLKFGWLLGACYTKFVRRLVMITMSYCVIGKNANCCCCSSYLKRIKNSHIIICYWRSCYRTEQVNLAQRNHLHYLEISLHLKKPQKVA